MVSSSVSPVKETVFLRKLRELTCGFRRLERSGRLLARLFRGFCASLCLLFRVIE